jgi:hypothetical protein
MQTQSGFAAVTIKWRSIFTTMPAGNEVFEVGR